MALWIVFVLVPIHAGASEEPLDGRHSSERGAGAPERDEKNADPDALTVRWKDGLSFESPDGDFRFKIGGQFQLDGASFGENAAFTEEFGSIDDGVEVRRGRLRMAGTLYRHVDFKVQYDFATGEAQVKDLFLALKGLGPVGKLTLGHVKEPFGLETLASSRWTTFMERGLSVAMSPLRNVGAQLSNTVAGGRLSWAAGVFKEADALAKARGRDNWAVTGRVASAPINRAEGRHLLHLAAAYSYRTPPDDTYRYRARPDAHLADPRILDTGSFATDRLDVFGLEAAWVHGPLSLQSEYSRSHARNPDGGPTRVFRGWYVEGSYWLTGEHRPYEATGRFDRPRPRRNFAPGGGAGAWQVAARYSALDLDSHDVRGREGFLFTLGLNWHPNPNTRFMWNFSRAELGDSEAWTRVFQMRVQVDF